MKMDGWTEGWIDKQSDQQIENSKVRTNMRRINLYNGFIMYQFHFFTIDFISTFLLEMCILKGSLLNKKKNDTIWLCQI